MYTGSSDGTAKCWVTEFGDNTVVYKGHTMSVTVIKFFKGLREIMIGRNAILGTVEKHSMVMETDG